VTKKVTDKLRARMSAMGKVGGQRRLETMTKAKRVALAYQAGLQGGAPIRIDHAKVRALGAQGLKYREIAEQMGISIPSVARIVNSKERKK
jgi:hypothetical protein